MTNLIRKIYYGNDTWTAPAGVTSVTVSTVPSPHASIGYSVWSIQIDSACDAYAWGGNQCGVLGIGSTTERCLPTLVCCGLKWRQVSGGSGRSAGITTLGDAYMWGGNECGALGIGSITAQCLPTLVCCGLKWRAIVAGQGSEPASAGISITGDGYAWGSNECGNLGNGSITQACLPTPICCGLKWKHISMGSDNGNTISMFGVTSSGDGYSWGNNICGVLGIGSITSQCLPTPVCCGLKWQYIMGGSFFAIGLTTTCDAYAWGRNQCGNLGIGSIDPMCLPTPVCCGLKWRQVVTTQISSFGITLGGDMYAWGLNSSGQLGNGTTTSACLPGLVCGGLKWRRVMAGSAHVLAVTVDGDLYAWGSNSGGQLGIGSITNMCVPTLVCCAKIWMPYVASKRKVFSVIPGTSYPINIFARFTAFAGESITDDIGNEGIILEYIA